MRKLLLLSTLLAFLSTSLKATVVAERESFPGQPDISLFNVGPTVHQNNESPISRASNSLTFSYANNVDNAFRFVVDGSKYAVAIGLPENVTNSFAGNYITKIIIPTGANCTGDKVQTFITQKPSDLTQNAAEITLTAEYGGFNTLTLSKPVEIKPNTTLYVGYQGTQAAGRYPAAMYNVPNSDPMTFLGGKQDSKGNWSWTSYAANYGSSCIKVVIEGDNLPEDQGTITITPIEYIEPGTESPITFTVTNTGANPLTTFEVELSQDNATLTKSTFNTSIANYNESRSFGLSYLPVKAGINSTITIKLLSVNGKEIAPSNLTTTSTFANIFDRNKSYKKNMVVEEGTGTWCGFCPRGIVGMETMNAKYTDGTFIPIAIHSGDEMAVSGYAPQVGGLPGARINRSNYYGDIDPNTEALQYFYDRVTGIPSFAKIDLSAKEGTAFKTFVFKASTTFSLDVDGSDFAIAFVVTENNVGPYKQTNAYAGSGVSMGGWESKSNPASTIYSDVARGIRDMSGLFGSIPSRIIKAGEKVDFEYTAAFDAITNVENCRFIAMLINKRTGEIENAKMLYSLSDDEPEEFSGLRFYMGDKAIKSGETVTYNNAEVTDLGANKIVKIDPHIFLSSSEDASNIMVKITSLSGHEVKCCAGGECVAGTSIEKKNVTIKSGEKLDLLFEYYAILNADEEIPAIEARIEAQYFLDDNSKQEFIIRMGDTSGVEIVEITNHAVKPCADGLEYSIDGEATVNIYSASGRLMQTNRVSGNGVISTSSLPCGLYIYNVNGDTSLTGKFTR